MSTKKQVYFSDNKDEKELLKEIEKYAEKDFMSESRLMKLGARMYIEHRKKKDR
jgi:hemerythrin